MTQESPNYLFSSRTIKLQLERNSNIYNSIDRYLDLSSFRLVYCKNPDDAHSCENF